MKKDKILILLSFLLILLLSATYSYSKYKTEVSMEASSDVAKWNISVNGCTVTVKGEDVVSCDQVDLNDGTVTYLVNKRDLNYTLPSGAGSNIRDGVFAPGGSAVFNLVINSYDTEVSFRYTIALKEHLDTNADIQVYTYDASHNRVYLYKETILMNGTDRQLDVDGNPAFDYVMDQISGTVNYSSTGTIVTIPLYIDWVEHNGDQHKDEFNAYDVDLGRREGSSLLLPISMTFEQVVS